MPKQSRKMATPTKVKKEPVRKEPVVEEFQLYGFLRGGGLSWFRDVYHHDSLVMYRTEVGAKQVREYGEKIAKINVRIEYVGE